MDTQKIVQDYYGASYFIEQNKNREMTIFIVDDNKVYLNLLKQSLKRENFSILTFTTGEECLDYLSMKPDLIILDYHLDGTNPYAKKGDQIYLKIKEELPDVEVVIISSDEKFQLISGLKLAQANSLMFKDKQVTRKLKKFSNEIRLNKGNNELTWGMTISIVIGAGMFITLLYLILKWTM